MSPGCTGRSLFVAISVLLPASVVVNDLDIEHVTILPSEADAPLLIDADAVLARAVALERLELIRWGDHEVTQIRSAIEVLQFLACALLNLVVQALHKCPSEYRLSVFILEGPDHGQMLKHSDIIVKR
jgi:hypothetical protein